MGGGSLRIYSLRQKIESLRDTGLDALFLMRFNARFAAQSAQAFVEELLHKQLQVSHVVTGYNFAFGKGRTGDTAFLDRMAQTLGFAFTACPRITDAHGEAVSSSAIREALAAGALDKAACLLGRPYTIEGSVKSGAQRGRQLGFPTANLSIKHLFKPRFGIYAVRAMVHNEACWHSGVASLGVNPMFALSDPILEVHLLDMQRDLYGQRLRVEFVRYLREEMVFNDLTALKAQMAADMAHAREILNAHF